MKVSSALQAAFVATITTSVNASPMVFDKQALLHETTTEPKSLIEIGPGHREWVTEDEKWSLKRQGLNFFDVTDTPELGVSPRIKTIITYPDTMKHKDSVDDLLGMIDTKTMRKNLEGFTSFFTRYYKSSTGAESSNWLFSLINSTLTESGAFDKGDASIRRFNHPWGQHSIIVTIPGQTENTVVVSAHQDSVNLLFPALFRSPGADDDGSGTVTILESLRVLLQDDDVLRGQQENTLEFHWYSAEEGGLLGSQAVWSEYERQDRQVKAMLQQDMTGYPQSQLDDGKPEAMGVINDFVDPGLTQFIKRVVTTYCDIPYVDTECGYACSDHASAAKAGYPSAFVIEADFPHTNHQIHSTQDTIERLSFEHMAEHAKLTIGFAYELAHTHFD